MGREELLGEEDQAWADLMEAAAAVQAGRRLIEGVVPGWSAHDTLWHVGYWVGRAAGVLELAAQGPPYPEEPDDESYYDEENAQVLATGRGMTWDEVLDHFAAARDRARDAVGRCEDRDLGWLSDRFTEEVEHYREHSSQIGVFAADQPGEA